MSRVKIAVITCYKQPDYVRAQVLRASLALDSANQVISIKNNREGLLRYPEVLGKLIAVRLMQHPDVYVLTFRGYEVLPTINLFTWPKPLIFDEFINPLEWLQEPRLEWWAKLVPQSFLQVFYRLLLARSRVILADTAAHAVYSAQLTYGGPNDKYSTLAVGTNEALFYPIASVRAQNKRFRVFYYGNMLPLHGLSYVIEAAIELKDLPIEFVLVGGSGPTEVAITEAKLAGARITYRPWLDFKKLPDEVRQADLCLGGPFGNTVQADYVVTGKTYQCIACGVPTLIGANQASGKFTNRKDCLTVPLGDSRALADSIIWAYKHPEELARIGKNGRRLYEKHFSNKILAAQLTALLHQL